MAVSGPRDFRPLPSGEPQTSGRNADGTFAQANRAALKHGGRSAQVRRAELPGQEGVRAALAAKRVAIIADLGGEDRLSRVQLDLVERYLELDTVASWLGGNVIAEGPLTAKGRSRAALSAYLHAADRVVRLATTLGLGRAQKTVSLDHYVAQHYPDTHDRSGPSDVSS